MQKLLAAAIAIAVAVLPASAAVKAYKNVRIYTGVGAPIANGVLVEKDGKIAAVGPASVLTIPADAEVRDLAGAVIIPGLVIAETGLAEGGRDDERAVTPEYRAIDGFDFYADHQMVLAGGVTTVQVSPGSQRLLPGQGGVVKLAGDDPAARVLRPTESLRVLLSAASRNPPRIYEPPVGAVSVDRPLEATKPQLASSLAGAVAGLRAVFKAAKEVRPGDPNLAIVHDYLSRGGVIRITANSGQEIRAATGWAKEFGVKYLLVDPTGLAPLKSRFESWKPQIQGAILQADARPGAIANPPTLGKDELKRQPVWRSAKDLLAAGIPVAFRPATDADLPEVLFLAGSLTAGLTTEQVLRMVTFAPAEMLGVADRVGSLEVGKDADFVVLSGSPFATRSRVQEVFVNGRSVQAAKPAGAVTVVQAGSIYTGTGDLLTNGAVTIEGTTIRGVGRDVSAPLEATVKRFPRGSVIVPGFLDLGTTLGVAGTAGKSPSQALLPVSESILSLARQTGVSTVVVGENTLVAFKIGATPRVVKDPVGVKVALQGNLTSQIPAVRGTLQSGKSYAESWTKYDRAYAEYETKKSEYDAAKAKLPPAKTDEKKAEEKKADEKKAPDAAKGGPPAERPKGDPSAEEDESQAKDPPPSGTPATGSPAAEKKAEPSATSASTLPPEPTPPTKPTVNDALEPYRGVFAGTLPVFVEARRADAMKAALALFRDEFKVRTIFVGADDGFRMADALMEKHIGVVCGPDLVRTVERNLVNLPQLFAQRGVPFGFQSRASSGVQSLPAAVQFAVRKGLGASDALAAFTAGSAKLIGVDSYVGTLAAGKDADLVVLSGPPFELSSRILAVMIDGQWVHREEE